MFDTDYITLRQRYAGPESAAVMVHVALHPASEMAFSMISVHELTLECPTRGAQHAVHIKPPTIGTLDL